MFKTLSFILPVLIPSWRFFQTIEPSPRVEWAMVSDVTAMPVKWRAFRPPPLHATPVRMLWRLLWNPDRNEELYVVSCAERIQQEPTVHSIAEIGQRIRRDIAQMDSDVADPMFRFRLVFVHRHGARMVQEVVFQSDAMPARVPAI